MLPCNNSMDNFIAKFCMEKTTAYINKPSYQSESERTMTTSLLHAQSRINSSSMLVAGGPMLSHWQLPAGKIKNGTLDPALYK